ncbi:MAG: branched-chain amino acid transporter substrate-binding protein [Parcubacteria group bacterium]|nr:branched-chain amino acid transporter substrate-binding protein [Parcubacteria group bacterium]
MKKPLILALILIVVIVVGWSYSKKSSQTSITGESIKIGLALGQTGFAGNWGEGEGKAIHLAYEEYKNKLPNVQFVTEDTKSSPVGTVNAVQKLVLVDHVAAVIGPTWSDSFQGGYPIMNKAKVPSISPSSAFEALEENTRSEYMFSTWWPQMEEIKTLALDMKQRNYKKVLLLHDEDAFDTSIINYFESHAPEVVPNFFAFKKVSVPIGSSDFRTEIAKIKNDFKPDAILVVLQDTSSVGPFMKQLQEQGVKSQVYETADAENLDNLKKFPGYFDGVLYAFPSYADDSGYTDLHNRFVKEYGDNASEGPAFVNAYNAARVIFDVISKGARTSAEITEGIKNAQVPGVGIKTLSFDENGQVSGAKYIMKEIQNNQFKNAK